MKIIVILLIILNEYVSGKEKINTLNQIAKMQPDKNEKKLEELIKQLYKEK